MPAEAEVVAEPAQEPAQEAITPAASADSTPNQAESPETVIKAHSGWRFLDLRELWRYRELLILLAWRDVMVRYKQTVLGVIWVVLQPLALMAAFSVFLARVGGIADQVEHYPLFVLTGLIAWQFFSGTVTSAAGSVVGNQSLVTKVYFPRLIIPLSAAGAGLVDFAVGLVLLALAAVYFGAIPDWAVILLPVIVLLLALSALGVGILLAALTVSYRDFRYVVPFCIQFWMFATPVIYMPVELLGPTARELLPLNPAYGLILNFRNAALGVPLDWYALSVSAAVGLTGFVVGCLYFRRVERDFADVI